MHAGLALALLVGTTLIGTTLPSLAGEGFDLVIPGRPGVPVIINGVDVSYAVVEGNFGLGKGVHMQPTVYGGRYFDVEPPANRKLPHPAESYDRSWSAQSAPPRPAQPEVPFYPPPVIVAPHNDNMGMPREHMNEPQNPGQRRGQRDR